MKQLQIQGKKTYSNSLMLNQQHHEELVDLLKSFAKLAARKGDGEIINLNIVQDDQSDTSAVNAVRLAEQGAQLVEVMGNF